MPPDEVRNVVHVRPGPRGDRRETDGSERREDGGGPPVRAMPGESGEGRRTTALDRALEGGGCHPIDDDEDELLGAHFASVRSPAYRSGARRRSRKASAGSASASR